MRENRDEQEKNKDKWGYAKPHGGPSTPHANSLDTALQAVFPREVGLGREDLTQAPTPSMPLPWAVMKNHGGRRLENFWRLYGTENWVTWPGQPVSVIESAKKKKGIK